MPTVKTYRKSFNRLSLFITEIGTNAPKPDNEDNDVRTVFSLHCDNYVDCEMDGVPLRMTHNVEIVVRGTDGAESLADAFEFAIGKLRSRVPKEDEEEAFERKLK